MKLRSAIKSDLFAAEFRAPKIDSLGDPLVRISRVVDFAALASEVDRVAPRVVSGKGGRPPFPTETMGAHTAWKQNATLTIMLHESIAILLKKAPFFEVPLTCLGFSDQV